VTWYHHDFFSKIPLYYITSAAVFATDKILVIVAVKLKLMYNTECDIRKGAYA